MAGFDPTRSRQDVAGFNPTAAPKIGVLPDFQKSLGRIAAVRHPSS
jgi:hypothetical protein